MPELFEFKAFISYSHRDMKQAKWLQKRLESYRLPAAIKKQYPGLPGSVKVFRDQTDLAGTELASSIQAELRSAEYLIVICSPNSARSVWVDAEVRYFMSLGRQDYIIPFIVGGEPESGNPETECYTPAMLGAAERHMLGVNISEAGRNNAFLKALSILLGIRFNRLADREKRRRVRRTLISCIVSAAVVITGAAMLWRNYKMGVENEMLAYRMYGDGITALMNKNYPAAVESFSRSAEAGNAESMVGLAYCLENGYGVETNPAEAFTWYMRAAENGYPEGMLNVAVCYESGIGTAANAAKAFEWYLKASDAGSDVAMNSLGMCYVNAQGTAESPELAVKYFRLSAEAGNDLAMYNLASCYLNGYGLEKDEAAAMDWMRRSAEAGNAAAMFNMAYCSHYGVIIPASETEAEIWLNKAADAGDPDALAYLKSGWPD